MSAFLASLSFTAPIMLAALVALPIIWWLLRALPPAPQRVKFPALMFLLGLQGDEETPVRTPIWLVLLRMLIAALVILALAGPVLNKRAPLIGSGPLVIAIDDGWTSARNWQRMQETAIERAKEAEAENRPVILMRTAALGGQSFAARNAATAAAELSALEPQPWRPDRAQLLNKWAESGLMPTRVQSVFVSDGLAHSQEPSFAETLSRLGDLTIYAPSPEDTPIGLTPALNAPDAVSVSIISAAAAPAKQATVTAYGAQAHIIARQSVAIEAGSTATPVSFPLPQEARNALRRIAIDGELSAGGVTLLDDRWRRPSVGLVSGGETEEVQPLLSDLYYLEKALEPHANVRKGTIEDLIEAPPSALIIADVGRLIGDDFRHIARFVEEGGLLIRFAGPRMAARADDLVPVRLRQGGRAIGGAMSWDEPQVLGSFADNSPFRALPVPKDVTVTRQVLAEPGLEVSRRTWARLVDGTPLVTAAERGAGHIVLFHVTANTDWSNLPLSGLFVDMLRTALQYTKTGTSQQNGRTGNHLPALQVLNGYGTLTAPSGGIQPVDAALIDQTPAGPLHPPGYYGRPSASFALNTLKPGETLETMPNWPPNATISEYAESGLRELGPFLLFAALLLALVDGLAALSLAGKLRLGKSLQPATSAAVALLILTFLASTPYAYADDSDLVAAANATRFAFIESGDAPTDRMALSGLKGLSRYISAKTALEPGDPIGLKLDQDELTLFPLIYWPITAGQQTPSSEQLAKIDRYLRGGGMMLLDTRDQDQKTAQLGGLTAQDAALRRILAGLDLPPLEALPEDHVLRRSFYLLETFPGAMNGGEIWVEATPSDTELAGTTNDGVSSVIIGSHDWASAWALDTYGRPIAPVVPGGEHQRKLAFRFGTNLAMYALTGNYKGDAVHTRALIERLGE